MEGNDKNVKSIRAIVTVGCICLWIAFLSSAISLFCPAWITWQIPIPATQGKVDSKIHAGLVVYCRYVSGDWLNLKDDCTWFKEGETDTPDWMIATRGLVGAGCGLMLLTALCILFLCGNKFQNPECSSLIITGNFLAFAAILCAVVTFGIKAADEYKADFTDRKGPIYLDWGYYLAIVGSGFSLISLIITSTAVYFTSNESSSYGRMQAHQNGNYMYMEQKT